MFHSYSVVFYIDCLSYDDLRNKYRNRNTKSIFFSHQIFDRRVLNPTDDVERGLGVSQVNSRQFSIAAVVLVVRQ